jgi:hypothetical protein
VQFSAELRERVLAGEITVSFRLWRRLQVKVGGQYTIGPGQIHIESIALMPFGAITKGDVRRAGEADKESLRRRAAHAGPIAAETLLYRIEFHPVRAGDLRRPLDGRA